MSLDQKAAATRLLLAVEHLAADSETQIAYLTGLGDAELVDELALEFDDEFGIAPQLANAGIIPWRAVELLGALDLALDRMSGPENQRLWTSAALNSGDEWKEIRRLARVALSALSY